MIFWLKCIRNIHRNFATLQYEVLTIPVFLHLIPLFGRKQEKGVIRLLGDGFSFWEDARALFSCV